MSPHYPAHIARMPARRAGYIAVFIAFCAAVPVQAAETDAGTVTPAAAPASRAMQANDVLIRAISLVGTPYVWGGNTPDSGFDCSGLVGYVFRTTLGIELPRVSRDMAQDGEKVERTSLVPGDLVFFGRRGKRVDHVGIYLGDGEFVHAPRRGRDVTVSRLDTGYWANRFLQARRVEGLGS